MHSILSTDSHNIVEESERQSLLSKSSTNHVQNNTSSKLKVSSDSQSFYSSASLASSTPGSSISPIEVSSLTDQLMSNKSPNSSDSDSDCSTSTVPVSHNGHVGCFCCCKCCHKQQVIPLSDFKLSKTQKKYIRKLQHRLNMRFDDENKEHCNYLSSFGISTLGDNFETIRSKNIAEGKDPLVFELWKEIGFQGTNPITDLRAAGMLSLQNLKYFKDHNEEKFHQIIDYGQKCTDPLNQEELKYYFPWAISGINITFMLYKLFSLDRSPQSMLNERSACIYYAFLRLIETEKDVFEKIYCSAFLALFKMWIQENCEYVLFNEPLKSIAELVSWVLAENQPLTVKGFQSIMQNAPSKNNRRFTTRFGRGSRHGPY